MTEPLVRMSTALSDRYTIEREIGSGGMATVYLAQDLKHDRKVAIKVLKPELAAVLGAERFLSEIKVTANLQHPHILPLHDSGEADGFLFYVMPYVEGESLGAKLEREKQLSVDDAVGIAKSVANALDYAHRHGVVHRDIKPANILLHDGQPMVADFGIALAVRAAGGARITETGLSLGTPQYMSPEQAAGDREVDGRSDIYSLGCVLYEMLTGEPPHTGPTVQAIIAKLLTDKARPVTELRETVPAHVAATVHKALAKLPADRFEGAGAFVRGLTDLHFVDRTGIQGQGSISDGRTGAGPGAFSKGLPWPSAAAVILVLGGVAAWGWLGRPGPAEPGVPTRANINVDTDSLEGARVRVAISPDGRWIVARGVTGDPALLYVRSAGDPKWLPLLDTRDAGDVDFSPDGEWVLFTADEELLKTRRSGGPRMPVAESNGYGHWGFNDTIYFTDDGLFSVPASGGTPELLLTDDGLGPTRPFLLPDGKGLLFGTDPHGDPSTSRIMLLDLETKELRELIPSGNNPRYVSVGPGSTGYILYGHGNQTLMGVGFDLETWEVVGEPVPLVVPLTVRPGGAAQFDISNSGTLIYNGYALPTVSSRRQLVRVDLDGNGTPYSIEPGSLNDPRFSPDGGSVAFSDGPEIRVFDLSTGTNKLIASDPSQFPVWSRGGEFIYFSSNRDEIPGEDGFRVRVGGSGEPTQLFVEEGSQIVRDVLPGDTLLLVEQWGSPGYDLRLARLTETGADFTPFLTADWNESGGQVSPDGRWVAYVSNERERDQVYVRTFPNRSGGPWLVSPEGGVDPIWAPDGGTLYFRQDSTFFAVEVQGDPAFSASPPRELFLRPNFPFTGSTPVRNWDIHPDGTHFVIVESVTGEDAEESTESSSGSEAGSIGDFFIVTNWFQELREKMGG